LIAMNRIRIEHQVTAIVDVGGVYLNHSGGTIRITSDSNISVKDAIDGLREFATKLENEIKLIEEENVSKAAKGTGETHAD